MKVQRICLIILFSLIAVWAIAQGPKVDSLKRELVNSNDSNRYNILWELAYELFDVDNVEASAYAREARVVALRNGDTLDIVMASRILGQLLRRIDKLEEAIIVLSKALQVSQRNNFGDETKKILNALALAHTHKAEYDKALDYHFQSLAIRERDGDKKQISISLNNIGFVYFRMDNSNSALEYYLKSLKAKEEANDSFDLDQLLINIGLCYNELADYNKARRYFSKAFEVCAPSCSNLLFIEGELGLGTSFFRQGDNKKAKLHYEKSLELSIRENNKRFQLENLIELTKVSLASNDLKGATVYLNQTERILERNEDNQSLLLIYHLKAEFFTKSKNFEQANVFQRRYAELQDSIFNANVFNRISQVQTEYNQRLNLASIESQSRIISLQEEAIFRQKLLNASIGAVALLTIGMAVVLFKINRQKQYVNAILDRRVMERTVELEKKAEELRHAHDEQTVVLKKVSSDLVSSLSTLQGLSNAATRDLPKEQSIYFKEAEATTERLVNYVNKYSNF